MSGSVYASPFGSAGCTSAIMDVGACLLASVCARPRLIGSDTQHVLTVAGHHSMQPCHPLQRSQCLFLQVFPCFTVLAVARAGAEWQLASA